MRRESMVLPIVKTKIGFFKVVRCFVHRESCRGLRCPIFLV
jgi:hypothetical protein